MSFIWRFYCIMPVHLPNAFLLRFKYISLYLLILLLIQCFTIFSTIQVVYRWRGHRRNPSTDTPPDVDPELIRRELQNPVRATYNPRNVEVIMMSLCTTYWGIIIIPGKAVMHIHTCMCKLVNNYRYNGKHGHIICCEIPQT